MPLPWQETGGEPEAAGRSGGSEERHQADGEPASDTDLSNRELGRTGARGAAWLLAAQAVGFITNFASIVVLARFLAPEIFGLMAMANTVSNLIMLFRDFGFSAPILTYRDLSQTQLSGLYWANFALGLVLTMATISIAPGVAWFYGQPQLTMIVGVLATGFLIATTGVVQSALLRRALRFRALAVIQIASSIAAMAGGIAAAALGWGIWSLVLMRLIQQAILGLGASIASRWRPSRYRRTGEISHMLRMATDVSSSQLTNYLSRNADNVLVGWYWGNLWLGFYDQAYKLLVIPMQQLGQPLTSVLLPLLSRLQDQPAAYRAAYMRVMEKLTLATTPLACVMLVLPVSIVEVVLGSKWLPTAPIISYLGIAMFYQPVSMAISALLTSQKRTKLLARISMLSAALTVLSFVVALPYGPTAVAGSYAISGALIRIPLLYWLIGKEGPISTRDQYRVLSLSLWAGGFLIAYYYGLSTLAGLGSHPFSLLIAAAAGTIPVMVASLWILPSGRAAIRDTFGLLRLAIAKE